MHHDKMLIKLIIAEDSCARQHSGGRCDYSVYRTGYIDRTDLHAGGQAAWYVRYCLSLIGDSDVPIIRPSMSHNVSS